MRNGADVNGPQIRDVARVVTESADPPDRDQGPLGPIGPFNWSEPFHQMTGGWSLGLTPESGAQPPVNMSPDVLAYRDLVATGDALEINLRDGRRVDIDFLEMLGTRDAPTLGRRHSTR